MAMGQRTVSVIPANPIYDFKEKAKIKKLRVAAYCRVSTELEEQQSSYQAQVDYYTMEIMKNPGWKFAGIYADEGISGTSTKNRTGFNKLIEDCMAGKIDLVLTKSISRFARNTLDCIQYIRKLKEKNIGVFFEKENVNTLDSTGEFLITILGSLAQEESRSLSTNTRWGVVRRFEKGQVMVNHNKFLGYTKNEAGELVIVPEEAEIVRLIFRLYLEGQSITQIKKYLEENGIKTVTGKNQWSTTTINRMLSNEKYMGDALLQKSYTVDYLTKKRVKNNGIVPQYYVEDSHEAIISKDLFHRIQEEKARRASLKKSADKRVKTDSGKYSSKYAFTELLICGECGKPYRRASWTAYSEKRIVWRCFNRLEHGKKYCQKSPTIDEEVLHSAIIDAFNSLIQDKGDFVDTLQSNIQLVMSNRAKRMDIARIEERIAELKKEMIGFVEENARCVADNTDFDEHYAKISAELKDLQKKKTQYTEQEARQDSFQRRVEDMKKFLNAANCKLSEFDNQLVRQLIHNIKVVSKDKIIIRFKSGLEIEQELSKK